jgi:N6-L-threonylcarbamoyladenine synthase
MIVLGIETSCDETAAAVVEDGEKVGLSISDIDGIAVTAGPGLVGALLVGTSTAKAMCFSLKKPLIGINHIEAHLYANFIDGKPVLPAIGLVVSGGHTDMVYVSGIGEYEVLGRTRDDAVGEAFDNLISVSAD